MKTRAIRSRQLVVWSIIGVLGLVSCRPHHQILLTTPALEQRFKKEGKRGFEVITHNVKPEDINVQVRYTVLPGDELTVRFINTPPEVFLPNISGELFPTDGNFGEIMGKYTVDAKGYIRGRVIGEIFVLEKTSKEIRDIIEQKLNELYRDPLVDVVISSLRVSVFGEVKISKQLRLPNTKTHLIEVINQSGGFTIDARLDRVKIIRNYPDDPSIIYVNLTNLNSYTYNELYMQDRDIIFIEAQPLVYFDRKVEPFRMIFQTLTSIAILALTITNIVR